MIHFEFSRIAFFHSDFHLPTSDFHLLFSDFSCWFQREIHTASPNNSDMVASTATIFAAQQSTCLYILILAPRSPWNFGCRQYPGTSKREKVLYRVSGYFRRMTVQYQVKIPLCDTIWAASRTVLRPVTTTLGRAHYARATLQYFSIRSKIVVSFQN